MFLEMDRTRLFQSHRDVLIALAIFRPCCSVFLYEWQPCYPWLAIVKAVVIIYHTREEKPIERYKQGFKSAKITNILLLSKVF